jgi:hypothetical protein
MRWSFNVRRDAMHFVNAKSDYVSIYASAAIAHCHSWKSLEPFVYWDLGLRVEPVNAPS